MATAVLSATSPPAIVYKTTPKKELPLVALLSLFCKNDCCYGLSAPTTVADSNFVSRLFLIKTLFNTFSNSYF